MIQDNDRIEIEQSYYERGILKKEVRSYEVSLWTLQDEFITVLRWSNIDNVGSIQNPKMTLSTDGTQEFSFSIPAKLYIKNKLEDNPKWYNDELRIPNVSFIANPAWQHTLNGNLMASLRKIKVIFNKNTEDEAVFEFMIIKVTEKHENDQITCEVDCEGLAFHELGKIGYKINLSQDNFLADYNQWMYENGTLDENGNPLPPNSYDDAPLQNVQYWCEQSGLVEWNNNWDTLDIGPNANTWYYEIQMDWSGYLDCENRSTHIVYEEPYVKAWDSSLKPIQVESYREKARSVSVESSNLYNITQTIAETFGIFCRYEYGYDENYQIRYRKIIFYNSYTSEKQGLMSLTYPYSSSAISRTMDSTDLTTKLYVPSIEDDTTVSGYITIQDAEQNPTKEDYIFNFDYLHTIGAITDHQYDLVETFEKQVAEANGALIRAQNQKIHYENSLPEIKAKVTYYQNAAIEDKKEWDQNQLFVNELEKDLAAASDDVKLDGKLCRPITNPDSLFLQSREKGGRTEYFLNFSTRPKGIDKDSLKLYMWYGGVDEANDKQVKINQYEEGTLDTTNMSQSDIDSYALGESSSGTLTSTKNIAYGKIAKKKNSKVIYKVIVKDGDITEITFTSNFNKPSTLSLIYMTYTYDPGIYYSKLAQRWKNKWSKDNNQYNSYKEQQDSIEAKIETLEDTCDNLIEQKEALLSQFEEIMGAAIREGYWSPDDYTDYGEAKVANCSLEYNTSTMRYVYDANTLINDTGEGIAIGWDTELLDGEDKLYFTSGIEETETPYICINLKGILDSEHITYLAGDSGLSAKLNYFRSHMNEFSFIYYDDYQEGATGAVAKHSEKYIKYFQIGGASLVRFAKSGNHIIPVLVIIDESEFNMDSDTSVVNHVNWIKQYGDPMLGIVTVNDEEDEDSEDEDKIIKISKKIALKSNDWSNRMGQGSTLWINTSQYTMVYPRIKISSPRMKTSESQLTIAYNNTILERYEKYSVVSRETSRNEQDYLEQFITISPEFLASQTSKNGIFTCYYTLSTAATSIYADAKTIMLENAYPKVSYNVVPNIISTDFTHTAYKALARIVMINDSDLKFERVFGYISQIELDLDFPQNDSIEVKNYKTKFEDLFSTIIAQTESLKRNEVAFDAALSGTTAMTEATVASMLEEESYQSIIDAYLDSYLDDSTFVRERLGQLLTEASQILTISRSSLSNLVALSEENASILDGFRENVLEWITPKVFSSATRPEMKAGDVWIQTDANGNELNRYFAFSDYYYGKTYDTSLAQITGAAVDIDALEGEISIKAQNKINIATGGLLDIGADQNINIHSNKAVIVSGQALYFGAHQDYTYNHQNNSWNLVTDGTGAPITLNSPEIVFTTGVISASGKTIEDNIVTSVQDISNQKINLDSAISSATSVVRISPEEINMKAAKIELNSASGILLKSSTNDSFSVFSISPTQIFMGTDGEIRLYSGGSRNFSSSYNSTANKYNVSTLSNSSVVSGTSSMIMNGQYFLLGTTTSQNSILAMEMKNGIFTIAAGNKGDANWEIANANQFSVTGTAAGLIGMQISANKFGIALEAGNNINSFIINENGITIGGVLKSNLTSFANQTFGGLQSITGSYVRIASEGIEIGSTSDLYINANNFKLQTKAANAGNNSAAGTIMALGSNLNGITPDTDPSTLNSNSTVNFLVNKNGAYIKGTIYADHGSFTGTVYATGGSFKGSLSCGSVTLNNAGYPSFYVDPSGNTYISPYVNTNNGINYKIYLWANGNAEFDGNISVNGTGNIGGFTLSPTNGFSTTSGTSNFVLTPPASWGSIDPMSFTYGGTGIFKVRTSGIDVGGASTIGGALTVNGNLNIQNRLRIYGTKVNNVEIAPDIRFALPDTTLNFASTGVLEETTSFNEIRLYAKKRTDGRIQLCVQYFVNGSKVRIGTTTSDLHDYLPLISFYNGSEMTASD